MVYAESGFGNGHIDQSENLIIGAWGAAAGTLFGFLVALSGYYIQAEQRNSAEESRAAATRARLITLLKSELSYDLQAIKIRMEAKTLPAVVNEIKSPLKFGFWRMISNSGDMKVMKDLDITYALSDAYANIDNTDYWEHKYIDAMTGAASTVTRTNPDGSKMPLSQIVLNTAVVTYEPTEQAVAKAIDALDRDPIQ